MIKHAKTLVDKGLSILADAGAFHFMGKTMELLEYQSSLPQKFDINLNLNLKGLCLYNQKYFEILSGEQKQIMVKHHGMAVRIKAH